MTVTADGKILAHLKRKDFVKAHLIQMSALYVFAMDFEKGKDGKPTPTGIRNYFDFITEWLWDIHPKDASKTSGTGVPRKKRTSKDAYNFMVKDLGYVPRA